MGAAFGPQPLLRFASVFVFTLAIGLTGLSERQSGTWIQSGSCSSKPFTFHSTTLPRPLRARSRCFGSQSSWVFVLMLAIGLTGLLSERVRDLDSER